MSHTLEEAPTRKCCLCRNIVSCSWNEMLKGYVCPNCYHSMFERTSPNETVVGQPLKRLPSFSIEFEIARRDRTTMPVSELDRALLLLRHGFKRTYDGSVESEYKSPIYCTLRAARKPLVVMDSLADLVSDSCGTHLHVECRHKELLEHIQGEVFGPLLTHMLASAEETMGFWGRYFSSYATPFNRDRYHCFSLESRHPTLEFRLPRFRSAEQYLRLIKFARSATAYIDSILNTIEQRCVQDLDLIGIPGPGVLGHHVLSLYHAHVARMPRDASWFTQLSQAERQQALSFQMEEPEQEEEDERERDEDDWSDF